MPLVKCGEMCNSAGLMESDISDHRGGSPRLNSVTKGGIEVQLMITPSPAADGVEVGFARPDAPPNQQ